MVDTKPSPRPMDLELPCAARVYDAFLGGSHNFSVERCFVDRVEERIPGVTEVYRENRAFVRRAVEYLVDKGVRQFLDLGSGIPSIGSVHEVARRRTDDFRVLYIDNEPLTVAHSQSLFAGESRVAMTEGDCRYPGAILRAAELSALLDLDRPVALLMSSVLHFLRDEDNPRTLVARYRDALAPGSHLLLSHATACRDPGTARLLEELYHETADPLRPRSSGWIDALFDGFAPVAPGITYLSDWRPDPGPRRRSRYQVMYGGLAVKR
jgi:hypothetical protein